jgi:hypothetical protein
MSMYVLYQHRQTNATSCDAANDTRGDTSIVMDSMLKDDDNDDDIADIDSDAHNNQVSTYVIYIR